MPSPYFTQAGKYVIAHEYALAADVNNIIDAIDAGFILVNSDISSVANSAEAWAQLAQDWAISSVTVEGGEFSAKYHAQAASASAAAAALSQSAAAASASAAASSEANALAYRDAAQSAQSAAASSASAAASSASDAASSESNAATSESNAAASASTAASYIPAISGSVANFFLSNNGSTPFWDIVTADVVGAVADAGGTFTGAVTFNSTTTHGGIANFTNSASGVAKTFIRVPSAVNVLSKNTSNIYNVMDGAASVNYNGSIVRLVGNFGTIVIDSGHVLFGNSSQSFVLDPTHSLRPNSYSNMDLGASGALSRWRTVYAQNPLNVSSDERLKDIFYIGDVNWLYDLNPVAFRFRDNPEKRRYGFGAQTTFDRMPHKDLALISKPETEDGTWGMSQTELIAPMLKLMQEQKNKIDNLEERIMKLESLLNSFSEGNKEK